MSLLIQALVAAARRRPEFATIGLFFCAGAVLVYLTGAAENISQQQVTMVIVGTISVLMLVGAFVAQKGPLRVIVPVFSSLFLAAGLVSMFYDGGVTAAIKDLSAFIREGRNPGPRGADEETPPLPTAEPSPPAGPNGAALAPGPEKTAQTPPPPDQPLPQPQSTLPTSAKGCTDFHQNIRRQARPGTKRLTVALKGGALSCTPDGCPSSIALLSGVTRQWPRDCDGVLIRTE